MAERHGEAMLRMDLRMDLCMDGRDEVVELAGGQREPN
jgi:hypothetical protein